MTSERGHPRPHGLTLAVLCGDGHLAAFCKIEIGMEPNSGKSPFLQWVGSLAATDCCAGRLADGTKRNCSIKFFTSEGNN